MKKLLSVVLAVAMVLCMGVVAFAASSEDAEFTKTYTATNANTSSPAETFTFKFTADSVTNTNKGITVAQMPTIANVTTSYAVGGATTAGAANTIDVALSSISWPDVGVYTYKVNEIAGTTAGVTYDDTTAYLKVTVVYDEAATDPTTTYYVAFATLSLDDADDDGITDEKVAGFENEYSAGTLAISKEVTGNLGDKTAYFDVKVKLTGETGKTYQATYPVTGGSNSSNPTTIAIGTETTFKIKHGDTITIGNLPYGVTYTVTETQVADYDEPEYDFSDDNKEIDSDADTVDITNNRGIVVDTGVGTDSLPYILLLAVVAMAVIVFVARKRRVED